MRHTNRSLKCRRPQTSAPPRKYNDPYTVIWNETNRRAQQKGRKANTYTWNLLWKQVRDEVLGEALRVETRREVGKRI